MSDTFVYAERLKPHADLLQDWLKEVDFQAFVTIRPYNPTSINHLRQVIHDFQRATEMTFRSPLSYVISYETKPCLNVHLLIAASRKLDVDWMASYLKVKAKSFDSQVQSYEPRKDGISYVLKCCDREDGSNWEMSDHMYLFLPKQPNENRHRRISRKLHEKRLLLGEQKD